MSAIEITRQDLSISQLRAEAARTADAKQGRRILAIAMVLDEHPRLLAAQAGGMDRQTLRDWVHRYNADGLAGLADAAEALKILFRHVAEVKNKAELVVLAANQRIGEEIRAIPKATAPHRPADKKLPSMVNSKKEGRAATGVPGTSRSRLQKIAAIPKPELKAIATKIQEPSAL